MTQQRICDRVQTELFSFFSFDLFKKRLILARENQLCKALVCNALEATFWEGFLAQRRRILGLCRSFRGGRSSPVHPVFIADGFI
jgi:hypothetical protein